MAPTPEMALAMRGYRVEKVVKGVRIDTQEDHDAARENLRLPKAIEPR